MCVYSEVPLGAAEMILAFLCSLEQFLRQNKNAESILASLWRKEPSECLQGTMFPDHVTQAISSSLKGLISYDSSAKARAFL